MTQNEEGAVERRVIEVTIERLLMQDRLLERMMDGNQRTVEKLRALLANREPQEVADTPYRS